MFRCSLSISKGLLVDTLGLAILRLLVIIRGVTEEVALGSAERGAKKRQRWVKGPPGVMVLTIWRVSANCFSCSFGERRDKECP